ncbi:hypothetical protein BKA70DRAFT_1417330 [Coprinopsis sp. MPI-PUGE-AT-0042]|nr:hypothetical protein BKA70DRAFT_1417330 [Coprinopsis sp. MPI-PUGE-AT-0042]
MSNIAPPSISTQLQSGDLEEIPPFLLEHASKITTLQLSPDGLFLAIGDAGGSVTIFLLGEGLKRVKVAAAGCSVTALIWHPVDENFVDELTAIKVQGWIALLAIDSDGTQLAVSYDSTVLIVDLPFLSGLLNFTIVLSASYSSPGSDPLPVDPQNAPYLPITERRNNFAQVPVKDYPIATGILFASLEKIVATFLSSTIVFIKQTDRVWRSSKQFGHAGHYIGGSSLSPSCTILAGSNINCGVDWYNVRTGKCQMTTKVGAPDQSYLGSFVTKVKFLDEGTAVVGDIGGQIHIVSCGNIEPLLTLGEEGSYPAQLVSAVALGRKVTIASTVWVQHKKTANILVFQLEEPRKNTDRSTTPDTIADQERPPPQTLDGVLAATERTPARLPEPTLQDASEEQPLTINNASTKSQYPSLVVLLSFLLAGLMVINYQSFIPPHLPDDLAPRSQDLRADTMSSIEQGTPLLVITNGIPGTPLAPPSMATPFLDAVEEPTALAKTDFADSHLEADVSVVVITETKVLTVTRAIPVTVTVTVRP